MIFFPEGILYETEENIESLKNISALQEAMHKNKILEGRVLLCDNEHNLIVDLNCMRGIIPRNEGAIGIIEGTTRDIAIISRVGKPVCFVITKFTFDENGNPTAILSRRKAQEICFAESINKLANGDIIKVKVTHMEPFGCFVDIGCGIASLIPIDTISISRISHPRDRFKVGNDIYAIVKSVEPNGKICLSHKELLGTWEENAVNFNAGETVSGIIRSVEEYGIFVELTPNLAGLAELKENVHIGQYASVYIKSLIPEKMKVKLIIVDSFNEIPDSPGIKYYFKGTHMNSWRYSPSSSEKIIETIF